MTLLPSGKPCPDIMTADEVRELLRLDDGWERTLQHLRNIGLPHIQLGRTMKYPRDLVLAWVRDSVKERR